MEQGTQITSRYQLIDKLGQGGMSIVYKAYDRLEKKEVALKQVATPISELTFNSKGASNSETAALIQEFSVLASLRHPHIISVLDYGLADGKPFFTMELVNNARTFIKATQDMHTAEQVDMLIQVLEALRYLHRRGVIHRDLKPDNVLVLADNQVKVLDFGLSVTDEVAKGRAGTLAYMSPETLQSQTTVPQSDLYAVGVMAYQMLTGQLPFPIDDIMGILMEPADTHKIDNHPAVNVIERLLLKDPDMRYQTADDCIRAFQHAIGITPDRENEAVRESFLQASSFIGRDAELQTLTDDLNKVLQGGNAFYLVGGESGVGKSRLLNELRVQGLVAGATVLRGQAVENGGLPFQLWRQIVRRLLLIVNVSDAQASLLKDLVPDINDFLGRSIPDTPTLTGKARQEQIITTIVDLIHSVEQPLILLLEDLQWTNESLIVLKHLLLAREQFTHLMIVGNYRNDEAPNLPNELAPVDIIHLERLTSEAVQQLSHSMLGKNGATEHVLELLQNETEGNLFFLVETVRALAEEAGSLDRIGKSTLPDKVFTGGMQRLMQRRLNKVDEQYQPIQTLAAVLGRQIDEALLQQHYPEHTINEWLYLSDNLAILQVQDNQWQFTHDKLREFILTHMDTQSAQHYHRLAAEAIETAYPDDPAYNEILLTHWHKTGNLDKEMHYAKPILESYLFIQDRIPEAEILIEQSLDRLPENDARRIFLLNWLAYAYLWFRRDTDRAAVIVEEAYQLAKAHDDVNGLAFSLNQLGNVAKRRKQYQQAEAYYKQSMGYDQMIDSHFGVASNLLDLGQIAQIYGDYQQAQDYYEQSIAIQQSIDDYRGIAVNYSHLGLLASEMGNYESAEDYFQQSVTLSQRIKHQTGIAHNLYRLSAVQFMQYKNHEAHDGFAKAMPIFEEINFPHGVVWCLNGLCRATLQQDDKEQVAESLYKSLSLTIDLNREQLTLYTLATIALYYHHTREHKKALAIASFIASYPPITKIDHILLDTDLDLATFEAKLSANEIHDAVERGKKWDVDMLVRDLLSEFSAVANRSD